MPDYLPKADGEFLNWEQNFITYAAANLAGLGLVAGDLSPITAAQAPWESAHADLTARLAGVAAAVEVKNEKRQALEKLMRALVRRLQTLPQVDDAERRALGITVKDAVRTASATPSSHPIAVVDAAQRLAHTIGFTDSQTPTRKAKPDGILGTEIWVAITAVGQGAPAEPGSPAYRFVALDTATPYVLNFEGADAGKMAHYVLRWVNSRGEKGPWSPTVSATIGG